MTRIFNRLGENTTQALYGFLLRNINPDDPIILEEAKKDRTDLEINKADPLPIVCRAILLLRLATGSASNLISDSTADVNAFRFWWERHLFKHGIVSSIPTGIDPIDLYTDIRESIDTINSLPTGSLTCVKDGFSQIPEATYYLKQFQRPSIWGMGL
jgi:hypothetical protein